MKRYILLSAIIGALPLSIIAQDDLYFTPKKSTKTVKSSVETIDDTPTYYSGSDRDVDEYNRQRTDKYIRDSIRQEIEDEYIYSRRMSRFDDFYYWHAGWYDPWYSPWYSGWYGAYYPWYDSWYGSWYYGGWYRPWYYSGWYHPWYYGGWYHPYSHHTYAYRGHTGTYGYYDRGQRHSGRGGRNTGITNRRPFGVNNDFGGRSVSGNHSTDNVNRGYGSRRSSSSNSSFGSSRGSFGSSSNSSFGGSRGNFGGGGGSRGGSSGGGFGSRGGRR